jgi:hypothetical protein
VTEASGEATLWLFPSYPGGSPYAISATPPTELPFVTFTVGDVSVSSEQPLVLVLVLQFVHNPPVTTATLSPAALPGGQYPDPVTVTLSANASPDFTIAATYYQIDGGTQLTYSGLFTVAGGGPHVVRYWSVDNLGVYETRQTLSFMVQTGQPPAITSPNSAAFVLGAANSFTVTATGLPTPTITQTGSLPPGIGLNDHLNGTGTLSGTTTTGGTFPITFTASNSAGTVSQSFTLTVSGPLATLSPASIDWSTVYLWSLLPKTVTLANIGTSALTISKISLAFGANTDNNDFGYLNFCDGTLAAGKSCSILVYFWADEVGSKSATLAVTDNSPGSPQQVSLSANVINPIAWVSPIALNFGTIRVGSSSMKSVQLINKGSTDLKVKAIEVTGSTDFAQTNTCPTSLAPGASCRIDVTFTPTAKTARTAGLNIADNDRLGKQLVALSGRGN